MKTLEKPYYSRKLEMPKNEKEGLQNFIQMIINKAESDDAEGAMYIAVDLLNDLWSGAYDGAMGVSKDNAKSALFMEITKQHEQAKLNAIEEYNRGFKEGQKTKITEMKKVLNI